MNRSLSRYPAGGRPRTDPQVRRRPRPFRFPGAAVLLALGAACRIFPEWESVTVRVPEPLPAWTECGLEPSWEVRAVWSGGEIRAEAAPDARVRLVLPRGETVAVLAVPVWAGRELRPGGAVYPANGEGNLVTTWEGGYRAEAARILILAGADPARFDLDRFAREAFARLGDPWLRPPETFAESFASETFRVTLLDPLPARTLRTPVLPGPAAPASPYGTSLAPDGEGRADAFLPPGVHRWYADWGRVSVEVGEDGDAVWVVKVDSGL